MENTNDNATQADASFGYWVRRQRKALDLTQDALADAVGCSVATIRKIEGDERRPSQQIAERLMACLHVAPDEQAAFVTWARAGGTLQPLPLPKQPSFVEPVTLNSQRPHNLPLLLTPLIGRTQELQAVCAFLERSDVRLLTLIGPPGIGKTRLSLEVGHAVVDRFADGVFFVALAPIVNPPLVAATIAQTIKAPDPADQSVVDALKVHLQHRQILIILDNFEQVLEAAPVVTELLSAAPQLKCLVTSRSALHLTVEHEWPVPALTLPTVDHTPLATLAQTPAVALFVNRAQAIDPAFTLTAHNSRSVAAICVQLDGLPLAIELAASWSKVLSPQGILEHLEHRLSFLTHSQRDRPTRHQTLRNAISWSYDLLSAHEQQLFMNLGVFAGSFTLDAASAVCAHGTDQPMGILGTLAPLVEHSLLWRKLGANGESFFGMLETIREYAREQLRSYGDKDRIQQDHANYYLELSEKAEHALKGPQQAIWLDRLDAQHPNLRAALGWALDQRHGEIAARMASALWRFWYVRGYVGEGCAWFETIVAFRDTLPLPIVAKVMTSFGQLLWVQGRYDKAQACFEESLRIQRTMGDRAAIARVLNSLGCVAGEQGDYQRAQRFHQESLTLKRQLGDTIGIANSLNNLGITAQEQADYNGARIFFEESLALRRTVGDQKGIAVSLVNLGQIACQQGRHTEATQLFKESLALRRELGDLWSIAWCLEGLAEVASAQEYILEAIQLWGAAAAIRSAFGTPLPLSQRPLHERLLATTKAQTSEESAQAAWAMGQTRDSEQAIDYAFEIASLMA